MPGADTDQAATEKLELEPAACHQTENTDTTQTATRQERRDSTQSASAHSSTNTRPTTTSEMGEGRAERGTRLLVI